MIMTLIEPIKKGGPYTILEQLERKMQVFHLHYEEKKSALKIAEISEKIITLAKNRL